MWGTMKKVLTLNPQSHTIMRNQIKAIIFDLDDTLYDCSGTLVLNSKKLAAKIISKAIKCSETEALKLQLELENRLGPQIDIAREIANLHNLPDTFCKEISRTINTLDVENAILFPDTMDSIKELKKMGYKLFLVTFGNRNIQKKKIKVLGLEKAFNEIIITDDPNGKNPGPSSKNQQANSGQHTAYGQPQLYILK